MREALAQQGVSALWVDIEDAADLEALYGEWVPVLVAEAGRVLCYYHLDQTALDAYLAEFS